MAEAIRCDRCGNYLPKDAGWGVLISDYSCRPNGRTLREVNGVPLKADVCNGCFTEYREWWEDP